MAQNNAINNRSSTLTVDSTLTVTAGNITATAGNVVITAGNLTMPVTNSTYTQGTIFLGANRFMHMGVNAENTFLGTNAGVAGTASGGNNTGIGNEALTSLIVGGASNTAIGGRALKRLTSGAANVMIGSDAGAFITTSNENTGVGYLAYFNGTGQGNAALGQSSLQNATSADFNTALGKDSLKTLTTGDYNCGIGYLAGNSLTVADSSNICIMNTGTAGNNNTIRIGTQGAGSGQQNVTFVAGIAGATNAGASTVPYIETATGQLATVPGGAVLMNTGTQSLSISSDASATTVNFATGAAAKIVTLGSTTTTSSLALKYGTADFTLASATGTVMSALDTGEITHALQPSFQARRSADVANVTGDGTIYTCTMDSEVFDRGSDYNNGTYTFTAPVTGLYFFSLTVGAATLGAAHTLGQTQIVTTGRTFVGNYSSWGIARASNNIFMYTQSILASMTGGDTATCNFSVFNSTKTVTFYGGDTNSVWCAWLVA